MLTHCPECNHEISDTAKFCPNCGHALQKQYSLGKFLSQLKKHKAILVIVICVIVLTVACFGLISHSTTLKLPHGVHWGDDPATVLKLDSTITSSELQMSNNRDYYYYTCSVNPIDFGYRSDELHITQYYKFNLNRHLNTITQIYSWSNDSAVDHSKLFQTLKSNISKRCGNSIADSSDDKWYWYTKKLTVILCDYSTDDYGFISIHIKPANEIDE